MRWRWLGAVAVGLASAACARPDGRPAPTDPVPLVPALAYSPAPDRVPVERPKELPNIDPRDLRPLVRPPKTDPPPARPDCRTCPKSDYDPSYLYLPDRNPGTKQPPCPCLPLGTYWVNAAYFLGTTQNGTVPALATVGGNGVPGSPGSGVLFGNQRLDHSFRSGIRLETGLWLDKCHNVGVEGSFFYVESNQVNFAGSSAGDVVLARPFLSEPGDVPAARVVAGPRVGSGTLSAESPLQFLGADANVRLNLSCEDHYRLDFLAGYRFIRMAEAVTVRSHTDFPGGGAEDVEDNFRAVNLFNGGQIGLAGEYRRDLIYVAGSLKTAFGATWHQLDVNGFTATPAGVRAGGFLARPSNIGRTHDISYAVAPEANIALGCQLTERCRAYVGYTFVYLNNVTRPGQVIDTGIGVSNGVARPLRPDANTDFWMHGINIGFEARF
jgi:hypothetical protein